MSSVSLTPTSYLVLGLVAGMGPMTSYDLKRMVGISIGYFWSFPHSQLYAEPARLAAAGLLDVHEEGRGRRRRTYSITEDGRTALRDWLHDATGAERYELRDLGILKLFFAGLAESPDDVAALARRQRDVARRTHKELEAIESQIGGSSVFGYPLLTLQLGKRVCDVYADFWAEVGTAVSDQTSARRASRTRAST